MSDDDNWEDGPDQVEADNAALRAQVAALTKRCEALAAFVRDVAERDPYSNCWACGGASDDEDPHETDCVAVAARAALESNDGGGNG